MIFKHDKMFGKKKKKKTAQLWLVSKDLKPTPKIYKNIWLLSFDILLVCLFVGFFFCWEKVTYYWFISSRSLTYLEVSSREVYRESKIKILNSMV